MISKVGGLCKWALTPVVLCGPKSRSCFCCHFKLFVTLASKTIFRFYDLLSFVLNFIMLSTHRPHPDYSEPSWHIEVPPDYGRPSLDYKDAPGIYIYRGSPWIIEGPLALYRTPGL